MERDLRWGFVRIASCHRDAKLMSDAVSRGLVEPNRSLVTIAACMKLYATEFRGSDADERAGLSAGDLRINRQASASNAAIRKEL